MFTRLLLVACFFVAFLSLCPAAWALFADVDDDGIVNAVDVQLVINAALGIAVDPSYVVDVDGDGAVNAVDVQLVINAALGIAPPGPSILPASGQPGSKVTIEGTGFAYDDPFRNVVFFGNTEVLVIGASAQVLTTTVPLVDAGEVTVRVEVDGSEVVSGLTFTILEPPVLPGPPGTVASRTQNDLASIAADTGVLLGSFLETIGPEDAENVGEVLDIVSLQLDAIGAILDEATQEELQALDEVLISSGLSDALGGIQKDLRKQMGEIAWATAKARDLRLKYGGAPGVPESAILPQLRFTLDLTAARLHHAMSYANVAMMGLSTAASFGGGGFSLAVGMAGMVMGVLNNVYAIIEVAPMQLQENSLEPYGGQSVMTIATNSGAHVIFQGTFEAETSLDQFILGAVLPGFVNQLGLGPIINALLNRLAGQLLAEVGGGKLIQPMQSQSGVPIFAYDFVGDPPTNPNPPTFEGGLYAVLDVSSSTVQTYDWEHDTGIPLVATQKAYKFAGDFWDPQNRPHVETYTVDATILVKIQRGYTPTITSPVDGAQVEADTITVEGSVADSGGNPLGKEEVIVTITSPVETIVATVSEEGFFSETISLISGENLISVTVISGDAVATTTITVMNYTLPATYCVVTSVRNDALGLVDPVQGTDPLFIESADVGGVVDAPRDVLFLPDGETLIVLNSPKEANSPFRPLEAFVSAINISSLRDVSAKGEPLVLGEGLAEQFAITPDGKTIVVPLHQWDDAGVTTTAQVHIVDARQPLALHTADIVDIAPEDGRDDFGPRDVAAGVAGDGRVVALVTTGFYKDGGPSDLIILDITNPYNVLSLGTVSVASRGGSVVTIPGQPLAIVSGMSQYYGGVEADAAVDLIDFSDPDNVAVRGTFHRASTFALGLAVMPGGDLALVSDAANNEMAFVDISDPDTLEEMPGVSPLWFPGTGGLRTAISPDGQYAVTTNNLSNSAVIFDLSDMGEPTATLFTPVFGWDYPIGVAFRSAKE